MSKLSVIIDYDSCSSICLFLVIDSVILGMIMLFLGDNVSLPIKEWK